jgi:hypothetical protein
VRSAELSSVCCGPRSGQLAAKKAHVEDNKEELGAPMRATCRSRMRHSSE